MKLSQEQSMIKEMTQRYVAENIIPNAASWDREKKFPESVIKGLGALGLMGMLIPERWGGAGADHISLALAIEEIARGDASTAVIISVNNSVFCKPILEFGSDQQKEKFLLPCASGLALGAFCLTEPQAGSDAASLKTKAVRQGDHYIINGVKQFVTSGKNAQYALVFAVTDAKAGKKGLSAFIVPTASPGYVVSGIENKLGQRASDTCQITLDNLILPADHRLGAEGVGYKIALSNLEGGRIGIGALSVGVAQAAYEAALSYAKERITFGKALIHHQAIAFQLADMATQIEAARLLVWRAAFLRDEQQGCLKEASMAKLFASEMAEKVCSSAIQIHGGYGYLQDFPVERYYRDVRVTQIYEGSSEIQRMVIARDITK